MLTLNLLPPLLKKNLATIAMMNHWRTAVIGLFLVLGLGTAASTAAWQMLEHHARTIHQELLAQQQRLSINTKSDITGTTTALNGTISALSTAVGKPRSWSMDLSTVLTDVPSELTITDLTVTPDGRFRLKGTAKTRESFVLLDQTLKKNTRLANVATASTASKRSAVPFDYNGLILATEKTL